MEYFPFFADIEGVNCLIVGGGRIALSKTEKLLSYRPRITIAAPEICEGIRSLSGLHLLQSEFCEKMLDGQKFVIAATDDRQLNHSIALLCHARGIPVNAVDCREDCSFIFPALIHRPPLSIGISTGGASPSAAVWLKERFGELIPDNMEAILTGLDALRPQLRHIQPEAQRAKLYRSLLSRSIELGHVPDTAEIEQILQSGAWNNE